MVAPAFSWTLLLLLSTSQQSCAAVRDSLTGSELSSLSRLLHSAGSTSSLTKTSGELELRPKVPHPASVGNDISNNHRNLEDDPKSASKCDAQFFDCLMSSKCKDCFLILNSGGIQWATLAPNTPCIDVVDTLFEQKTCTSLKKDEANKQLFCNTFDACVVWEDSNSSGGDNSSDSNDDAKLDCDKLTSCSWDGFKPSYLGDGVCHENIPGCYNSKICDYDGGDCCSDTCKDKGNDALDHGCGTDGFFCRDPKSKECITCENGDDDEPPKVPSCSDDETAYRVLQFDSYGDGWDFTKMTISKNEKTGNKEKNTGKEIYSGSLKNGAEGTDYVCLSNEPSCYHVELRGGVWGNEISWQVKPMRTGAPDVANGGSPINCNFPVAGGTCERSCNGQTDDKKKKKDDDYQTYEDLAKCLDEKCVIQWNLCALDSSCKSCLVEDPASYCMANDKYNALISCTLCNCIETEGFDRKTYCDVKPDGNGEKGNKDETGVVPDCSGKDVVDGTSAVAMYSECSGVDSMSALLTNYDNDNFGLLDDFESCATMYKEDMNHGGKTALGCMRILQDAIDNPDKHSDATKGDIPVEAIASLANDLLHNGEAFCDCTSSASRRCPVCKDFLHFKTLLYESMDGCRALDDIDCDAWQEYYKPCKANLEDKFGSIKYNKEQCDYIKDTCGNVGPFPSFRKLDCEKEIMEPAWNFYLDYEKKCLSNAPKPAPKPAPRPAPADVPVPVPSDSSPSDTDDYVPPEKGKKKSHGFRNFVLFCLVGGGCYYAYTKKYGEFDYSRFRRTRNAYADQDNSFMYESLTRDGGFEPASLPPRPSTYGEHFGTEMT